MSQSKVNPPRRIKWTTQQSRAIVEHGRNVFVSASAGTGKTAVLSGSCVNVVTNPSACPDVWSVLVVTFTEMAAEEMRSRIAKQLSSEMETTADATLRRHLRRQLILLGAADISTIHSFCKRIITEHFYEIGLDPTFGIIDADEAKLLKTEILEKTIDWAWKQNNIAEALRQLMTRRDLRMTEGFPATIIEISDFLDGVVSRDNWLERAKVLAEAVDPFATDIAQAQKQIVTDKLQEALDRLEFALKIYNDQNPSGKWAAKCRNEYIKPVQQCIEQFKAGWWKFERPKVYKPTDVPQADFIGGIVGDALDSVRELKNLAILNPEYLNKFAGAIGTQTRVLVELVRHFDDSYCQAKKAINCLDFADLEHYALRLLQKRGQVPFSDEPSQTALKLRKKYKYVFVDEYQDINDVQQAIIDMVGSFGNVFAVGDPKQSIYRWRGARPEIFIEHLGLASAEPESSNAGLRVDLNVNFRSVKPILDFANKVFGRIMTASFAGIDYDESAYLKPHSQENAETAISPAVELHILDEAQADSDASPFSDRQLQAAMIARRIKQLIGVDSNEQIIDKETKKPRPVEYRDIVILMRSLAGKSDFVEALRLAGIPVSCDAAAGYFEATEITDMLCLLKVLDNPRRDIEFAGTLRCPFFRFSDTELTKICLQGKKNNRNLGFYDCVISFCESGGECELTDKLAKSLAMLDEWRTVARRGRLAELVWHIFRQTGYLSFVCALPDGPARRANLLKLHDRAIQFEGFAGNSGVPSLTRFIVFLEKLIAAGEDWSKPQPEAGTGNTVAVMSIHKSKGLEFPIVFVADLDSQFSKKDFSRDCVLDERLTLGLKIIDAESNSRLDSPAYQVIEERNRRKSLAEEMRILYVAMTRAMNRLVLVGCKTRDSCRNILTAAHSFAGQSIPSWHLEARQNHLDWILSALGSEPLLHQVFQTELPTQTSQDNLFSVQFYDQPELAKLSAIIQHSKLKTQNSTLKTPVVKHNLVGLKRSLDWQYPFGNAPSLPAKRTVTQWTHRNDEFAKIDYSLAFDRKPKAVFATKQIDSRSACPELSRRVGTATHLVMSKLDMAKPVTTETVNQLIEKLVKDDALVQEIASQINAESIAKFFRSKLGQTVLDKKNIVRREWPFTFAVPASQWDESATYQTSHGSRGTSDDFIIVQGIIDLLVKTPKGLVVIDFKTDDVSADGATKRAELYHGQLDLYAKAASIILGQKIDSKWLCFLRPGCEVEV
jgi:ATP-dependent helicase/nuclease subunit A